MRRLFAATLLGALTAAATSSAQTSDAAVATELFSAGLALMKDGDFNAACPKLADSARLDPKVGTLARLGECEEKLSHLATARARWQQALNLARVQNDERIPLVEAELARLDRVVPKLRVTLAGPVPPGLGVRLDDVEVGAGSLGVALPTDPGRHRVSLSAPGKLARSADVEAKADGAVVPVDLLALEDEPVVAPVAGLAVAPPTARMSEASSGSSGASWRAAGLATGAVGLVAVGVGSAFGVVALSKRNQSNAEGCDASSNCPGASFDTRSAARSAGDASTGLFIAGGALLAGGVTAWLLAPRGEPRRPASLDVAPSVGPGWASVSVQGRWR